MIEKPKVGRVTGTNATALDLLRVAFGTSEVIRVLSESYRGCFVHYARGRSQYCTGDPDTCEFHKIEKIWKGYTSVEVWSQAEQAWLPKVLEISECLDQDFRGRCLRGTVWELTHLKKESKKKKSEPKSGKVVGKLWDQLDPATLPMPYPMSAVLDNLFHFIGVRLDEDNPLPPRLLVEPSKAAPPRRPGERPVPTGPKDEEKKATYNGRMAEMFQMPRDTVNGNGKAGHQ